MRSLLIAPADEQRLAEALESGADAVIVDLAQAAPATREEARDAAARFLKDARGRSAAPALIVRVNGLISGRDRRRSRYGDGSCARRDPHAGEPRRAERAAASAELAVREAEFALPDAGTRIIAVADTAQSLFSMGSYRGSSARLIGVAWSAEPMRADIGAETDRDRAGDHLAPIDSRGSDAARRDVGARGGDRRGLPRRSRPQGPARRSARRTARRLCRQDGDRPAQVGAINAVFPSRSLFLAKGSRS